MFRGFGIVICVVTAMIGAGFFLLKTQVLDAYLPQEIRQAMVNIRSALPATGNAGPMKRAPSGAGDDPAAFLWTGPKAFAPKARLPRWRAIVRS